MTNTALLSKIIEESGIKKAAICKKLDISYHWLNKKLNNEVPFKAYEIQDLCELLHIDDLELKDRIFFAHDVDK